MRTEILKTLQSLKEKSHIGNEIFSNPEMLMDELSCTLAVECSSKKLKNLLRIALIDMDAYKRLSDYEDEFVIDDLICEMDIEFSIHKSDATEVICATAEFLGIDTSEFSHARMQKMSNVYNKDRDKVFFGNYEWIVLEEETDKMLILTKDIVADNIPYHREYEEVTWAGCDLNKYLNDDFYNKFSPEDKQRIIAETVITPSNPWYGTFGGESIKSAIFLLSIEEIVKYFGDSGQLKKPARDHVIDDQYNTERIAYKEDNKTSWWWLRSPGATSNDAAFVAADGRISLLGDGVDYISIVFGGGAAVAGIRPALWLSK